MEHALQYCRRRHAKLGLLVVSITSEEEGGGAILENYEGIENLGRSSLRNSTSEFVHHAHFPGEWRTGGGRHVTHVPLSRVGSATTVPLSRVASSTSVPLSRVASATTAPLSRVGSVQEADEEGEVIGGLPGGGLGGAAGVMEMVLGGMGIGKKGDKRRVRGDSTSSNESSEFNNHV
jgi:hypothetical protein